MSSHFHLAVLISRLEAMDCCSIPPLPSPSDDLRPPLSYCLHRVVVGWATFGCLWHQCVCCWVAISVAGPTTPSEQLSVLTIYSWLILTCHHCGCWVREEEGRAGLLSYQWTVCGMCIPLLQLTKSHVYYIGLMQWLFSGSLSIFAV